MIFWRQLDFNSFQILSDFLDERDVQSVQIALSVVRDFSIDILHE